MALLSALLLGIVLFFFSDLLAKLMLSGQEAVDYASIFLKLLAVFIVLLKKNIYEITLSINAPIHAIPSAYMVAANPNV